MIGIILIATDNELIKRITKFCDRNGFAILNIFKTVGGAKKSLDEIVPDYVFVECGESGFQNCLQVFKNIKLVFFTNKRFNVHFNHENYLVLPQEKFNQELLHHIAKHNLLVVDRRTGKVVDLKKRVSTFCLEAGILPHLSGYKYVVYAIIVTILNFEKAKYLTKQVYPKVAQKFGVSESIVERTIRHALIVAGKTGKLSKLNDLIEANVFNPTERISNGQFISVVADRFLYELKVLNAV